MGLSLAYAVTHLRCGGWVRSINSIVFNPTCVQQTGKFQITADTRPFNVDALRASIPLLLLLDSLSPNRLISLTLRSSIHSTAGFILHIARNNKYVHNFMAKIKGTDVQRRTDKISWQNLWIVWHCLVLQVATSCWFTFIKPSWQQSATKKIYATFYQAIIEWAVAFENESIVWFLDMLTYGYSQRISPFSIFCRLILTDINY